MIKKLRYLTIFPVIFAVVIMAGCSLEKAQIGDTVSIKYTLVLDDGTTYYTTGDESLAYKLGEGELLPDLEEIVTGMKVGEAARVKIPPERAYGPRQPELILTVGREELPAGSQPQVGMQIQGQSESGSPLILTITQIDEDSLTLDANHPLAGQTLNFQLELMGIEIDELKAARSRRYDLIVWFAIVLGLGAFGIAAIYKNRQTRQTG